MAKTKVWGETDAPIVIEHVQNIKAERTSPARAEWAIKKLAGLYGVKELNDADIWTASTMKVLLEYPFPMVAALVDPIGGIASQLTFFPGVPDVSKRLFEMKAHMDKLYNEALAHPPKKLAAPEPDPRAGTTAAQRRATVLKALGHAPKEKTEVVTSPHESVRREEPVGNPHD